jgi:hypothetical protein
MNDKIESGTIFSNDALRGKPYLDIDRVITEGKADPQPTSVQTRPVTKENRDCNN